MSDLMLDQDMQQSLINMKLTPVAFVRLNGAFVFPDPDFPLPSGLTLKEKLEAIYRRSSMRHEYWQRYIASILRSASKNKLTAFIPPYIGRVRSVIDEYSFYMDDMAVNSRPKTVNGVIEKESFKNRIQEGDIVYIVPKCWRNKEGQEFTSYLLCKSSYRKSKVEQTNVPI